MNDLNTFMIKITCLLINVNYGQVILWIFLKLNRKKKSEKNKTKFAPKT